jgi:hypothetical protein
MVMSRQVYTATGTFGAAGEYDGDRERRRSGLVVPQCEHSTMPEFLERVPRVRTVLSALRRAILILPTACPTLQPLAAQAPPRDGVTVPMSPPGVVPLGGARCVVGIPDVAVVRDGSRFVSDDASGVARAEYADSR